MGGNLTEGNISTKLRLISVQTPEQLFLDRLKRNIEMLEEYDNDYSINSMCEKLEEVQRKFEEYCCGVTMEVEKKEDKD